MYTSICGFSFRLLSPGHAGVSTIADVIYASRVRNVIDDVRKADKGKIEPRVASPWLNHVESLLGTMCFCCFWDGGNDPLLPNYSG